MNLFRGGEGSAYHEIVCDVASKIKTPYNEGKDIEDIENAILETILTKTLDNTGSSLKHIKIEALDW